MRRLRRPAAPTSCPRRSTHAITRGTADDAPLPSIDEDGAAVGAFPVALRGALARMGLTVKVEPVAMPFASVVPARTSGRVDATDFSLAR